MTNGFTSGQDAIITITVQKTVDYLIDRGVIATPQDIEEKIEEHAQNCPAASGGRQRPGWRDRAKAQAASSAVAAGTVALLWCIWQGFKYYVAKGG